MGSVIHHHHDQARQRCWRYDWILDLDIKGFFDNIPQDLLLRAVKKHAKEQWMVLYIERWLKAPVQEEDGQLVPHKNSAVSLVKIGQYKRPHFRSQFTAARRSLNLGEVTVRTLQNSFERYPFDAHKTEQWSLEHIHAQNAEPLNKKEQWQEWLREHRRALEEIRLDDDSQDEQRGALLRKIDASIDEINRDSFAQLVTAITAFFSPVGSGDNVHSITNLALLSGGVNSALNNSVFEVKRRKILELDRAGAYIPICTRRVFFKYYTDAGDQQIHLWSVQDRECYMEAMMSPQYGVLKYLKPTPGAAQ